jgi:predicted TIM-barrel fold metal-dependent hydrolase
MSMETNDRYRRIYDEVESVKMIDTHEHLMSERARLGMKIDLFYWFSHYASSDLVSAGMSQQVLEALRDSDRPLDERWAKFEPFWDHVRTTGYGRALLLAANDLFGVEDINREMYQELSEKISASNTAGWYDHVLREKANIDLAILHPLEEVDPTPLEEIDRRFFAPVLAASDFISPCNRIELAVLERKTGVTIHTLDDWLEAIDVAFERAVAAGVVGVKVGVAYVRSLHFEKVAWADAERVFNALSRYPVSHHTFGDVSQQPPVSWEQIKPAQDFVMHHVIRRAIECDLPMQIHTGLQEGNGNFLANANPLQLVNLLIEYPEARFDLFHAGYPYQSEMATLGKNFPNVYVDLCWVHVISPWVARQTLHEWIETVPANKIFGFGGDYIFVEGAYAHSRMARRGVAQVLAEKVEGGYLTEDEAIVLARKLLRENAAQFFRLSV